MELPSRSTSMARRYASCFGPRPASWPRQEVPVVFWLRYDVHALGSSSILSVWPVGAVSKMTLSYVWAISSDERSEANRSNAAISTVHEPLSCSSMLAMASSGRTPRYGPTTLSRYWAASCTGSTSSASSPGHAGMGVGSMPMTCPNTSPRFDAGSVVTSSTRRPASARAHATAHDTLVLPTPPLPVRKRYWYGASSPALSGASPPAPTPPAAAIVALEVSMVATSFL